MSRSILIIGGSGIISTGTTNAAIDKGWNVTVLNRGRHGLELLKDGYEIIQCDINDTEQAKEKLKDRCFDNVIDFVCFNEEDARKRIALFSGKCGQYIYISSATVYERPSRQFPIREDTPHKNPYSAYARNKYAGELTFMNAYRETGFPVTIIRPSLTYGDTQIPMATGSWTYPWSFAKRILDGKPVVVHGDGTGLWSFCHNTDFAKGVTGLMENHQSVGETFHITTDEILTWDESVKCVARALGKEAVIVHATAEQISRFMPGMKSNLLGDKSTSAVLDTSKIKRFVPDFRCEVRFEEGMRRTVAYILAHPEWQKIDEEWDKAMDAIIEADKNFKP